MYNIIHNFKQTMSSLCSRNIVYLLDLRLLLVIGTYTKATNAAKLISFADDTRLYSGVGDVTDCDNLQFDLNTVYDWASSNNMLLIHFLVMFFLALMGLLTSPMLILTRQ